MVEFTATQKQTLELVLESGLELRAHFTKMVPFYVRWYELNKIAYPVPLEVDAGLFSKQDQKRIRKWGDQDVLDVPQSDDEAIEETIEDIKERDYKLARIFLTTKIQRGNIALELDDFIKLIALSIAAGQASLFAR